MLTGDMIRRSAERFPDKAAVIWDERSITFRELDLASNRLANALADAGVGKGDRVVMVCRNRLEYATVFFGVAKSGAILVNISVQYTPEQFTYAIETAGAKALIVEAPFLDAVAGAREQVASLERTIVIGGEGPDAFEAFADAGSDAAPEVDIAPGDPFCMTFTGGTTGLPKGVLASHRNRDVTAHTVMVEEKITDEDVVAIVTPLFHVAALNIMFQPAVLAGATSVFLTKWSVAEFAELCRRHGITAGFMVPTQALMVASDEELDRSDLATLRNLSFAGAPMPDWVQRELMGQLPNLGLTQIYGQSEVGVITALPPRFLPEKLGSVGRQAYNVDLALLGPDGEPVGQGEVGELVSRGDNVMIEYFNNPEQTEGFFRHGWGWTGDLARMDEDGFIYLVDRSKDMLISGGENIYPKEIENAIFELPEVGDCAVIGIPDPKWGEVPLAYVVPRAGEQVSAERVIEHCRERLTRFKVPSRVIVADELPKTAMGKVQKHVLRDEFLASEGGA